MELENIQKKEKSLDSIQTESLFIAIARGKDATEWIETSKGKFKVKFARAKDLEEIARRSAYRMGGIPSSCFAPNASALINQIATLDVLVVEGPAWYQNIIEENPNFSWSDMPSVAFIQEVYAKAYDFRVEMQEKIEHNPNITNTRMDDNEAIKDSNTGVFDGISS